MTDHAYRLVRETLAPVSEREQAGIGALRLGFAAAGAQWDASAKRFTTPHAGPPALPPKAKAEPNPSELERTLRDGKVVNLPDSEDSPDFSPNDADADRQIRAGEESLDSICADRVGLVIPDDKFRELVKRRETIHHQSHEIAAKLTTAGVSGYKSGPEREWLVDVFQFIASDGVGKCTVEQPRFRRCNFIPSIAQQKRAFTLRHLEYWLHRHPHSRFWTFTCGERCTVSELRPRFQALHRKISKLNAEPFMSTLGVEIVFRASETGSLTDDEGREVKDPSGAWLYHPHAHCIVEMTKGRIRPEKWRGLLQAVKSFWKDHWDEGRKIDSVREVAKYPMKPADTNRLSEKDAAALYHAMRRLHLVQPLGSLKEQIKETRKAGDTLVWSGEEGGGKVVRVRSWNGRPSAKKPEEVKQIEEILTHPGEGPAACAETQFAAILPPGPYFGQVVRPALLVRGEKCGPDDIGRICQNPKVRALISAHMPAYLKGEAERRREHAAIRVHTSPVTVRDCDAGILTQAEMRAVTSGPLSRCESA